MIRILPDYIANQIAAGEVVQRPESVVKELVENCLDANSSEIAVLVKDAGKQLIHIVDNGSGMSNEDISLSIKRHATSKIFTQDQLEAIITYGFRGEALASIASVAKLEIRSKRKDDEIGTRLLSEPGDNVQLEPFHCDNGTQIFVKSLFFNTPARRKFLRSNITEFRHISETMIKFAIAHYTKRFTFYDDNNIIFDVKPESLMSRIEKLIGNQVKDNLILVEYIDEIIEIRGYIGTPALAAKKPYGDYLYLNQRPIKSRSLSHAIFTALEHLLDKNSKPFYVLFLTIDPSKVDINVHPQKHEVKFENERIIYNFVLKAVSNALGAYNLFPMDVNALQVDNPFSIVNTGSDKIVVNKITGEIVYDKSFDSNQGNFNRNREISNNRDFSTRDISAYQKLFEDIDTNNAISEISLTIPKVEDLMLIGDGVYQINYERKLIYIDLINSHRRILYEKALNSDVTSIHKQELLFPYEIDDEMTKSNLIELNGIMNKLGYEYEFEENKILLKSVPAIEGVKTNVEGFIKIANTNEILSEKANMELISRRFAETNSFTRSERISENECLNIIEKLIKCKTPQISSNGKLNYYVVEKKSIINQFK